MDLLNAFSEKFWDKDIWLPPNVTWADFKPNDKYVYCDHRHLLYPFPMALVMLLLRFAFEKYWLAPIGISLGIKYKRAKKAPPNDILEKAHQSKEKLKHKQITGLAKQLDWPERKVERWLRVRRTQDKPTTLVKFCENSWRCCYYVLSFTFGIFVLWDKPWLWDIKQCWVGYPLEQSLTNDVWWYYMISMSFYYSLCISQFFDVKRKDFWQMFIHHIATVTLMSLSWVCNLYRAGTLVLVVHDCADIFLDAAKMAKYASLSKICDILLGVFTVLWIVTRIGIYPFWIIYSTSVTAPDMVAIFPAYYIFNSLLILLLVLHVIWTYLILRVVYNSILMGSMDKDIRSSSSEELSESSGGSQSLKD